MRRWKSPLDPEFLVNSTTHKPYPPEWFDEYVRNIIECFGFKTRAKADYVLKQHYETTFGIFDHRAAAASNSAPLSGMAFSPGRDIGRHEAFSLRLQMYEDCHIYETSKVTFLEYMNMTRYAQAELNEVSRRIFAKREADEAERRRILEQTLNAAQADSKREMGNQQ